MRIVLIERVQLVLPAAEAIEIPLRILREIQLRFCIILLQLNNADHNDFDSIAYAGIFVEGGHHVHDGQQIANDIFVKCRHCGVCHDQRFHVPWTADRAATALHVRLLLQLSFIFEFRVRMLVPMMMIMELRLLLLLLRLMMVMTMMTSHLATALYLEFSTRLPLESRLHAAPRLACATIANRTVALALAVALVAQLVLVPLLLAPALMSTPVLIGLSQYKDKHK